jgi:ubiquinol-cytochrome c reductase cytochrome c1 subunit
MVDFLKKLIGVAVFLFAVIGLVKVVQNISGGEALVLDHAPSQTNDLVSLHRGSKVFGKAWFGATPPDLSVIARAKNSENGTGPDYLYTYLRGFYQDDTRPTGWNNTVFPNVGMPHALWELQGIQKPVYVDEKGEDGKVEHKLDHLEVVVPGKLSKQEYDETVADLVGYLEWMSEPTAHLRHQLGVWVLIFLGLLAFLTWRLNASYWKEVH